MGKITLPYLERSVAKGRTYYRYRRDNVRLNLPNDPSTPEFMEAYQRIHAGFERGSLHEIPAIRPGSIADLIVAFKTSAEFKELKQRVREFYIYNLDLVFEKLGNFEANALTRRVVLEWRDSLAKTPAKANNLIRAISRLYSFGIDRGIILNNPLVRIRKLKVGEYRPWQPEEIEAFRKSCSFSMRLALDLALYTGQRLGDILAMRWDQIYDGGILVTQQKTGTNIWVPLHKELQATLDGINNKNLESTILLSSTGQPYKVDHFKHEFKRASRKAGLPEDLVFHGLRKTAAVILAEAGCTTEQIKAITGHRTDSMAAYYARQANQKVLAKEAMKKFEATPRKQSGIEPRPPNRPNGNCLTFQGSRPKS